MTTRRPTTPSVLLAFVVLVASAGCDGAAAAPDGAAAAPDGAAATADGAADEAVAPADGASGAFTLTVENGFGSGRYAAGETVHIWAANDPRSQILERWTGDVGALDDARAWHTRLTMPARDVTVSALLATVQLTLTEATFAGVAYEKPVRYYAPPTPKGLILFFHGTDGNGAFIVKTEPFNVALAAVRRGYAVASFDAEEVQAGDTDGNGAIRWQANVSDPQHNPDVQNVKALVAWLVDQGRITAQTPLYAIGMSNGGAFSVSLAAVLPLNAAASYCASGRSTVATLTTTPTAWLLCEHDSNPQVSNADAQANFDALRVRNIDSELWVHPASPLYAGRFARIAGVDLAASRAIAAELRDAKLVDERGFFVKGSADVLADVQAAPASFARLVALSGPQRLDAEGQLRIMVADHRFYDDWSARTLDFFDAHR